MTNQFIISTESTSDLPRGYATTHDIRIVSMPYVVNGVQYGGDTNNEIEPLLFYQYMRENKKVSTSMVNEQLALGFFTKLLEEGKDILHISFASVCSGTFDCMTQVAERLNATHSNKIIVVDSKGESCAQGMAVMFAVDKRIEGADISITRDYVESMVPKVNSLFTVHDLKYLARGGRIKKSTAYIANSLQIKPILYVDKDGTMTPLKKVFMRKVSLASLVKMCLSKYNGEYKRIVVSHCGCLEDAMYVCAKLRERCDADIMVSDISSVVGCHCGPGTVSIFVVGDDRTPIFDQNKNSHK